MTLLGSRSERGLLWLGGKLLGGGSIREVAEPVLQMQIIHEFGGLKLSCREIST